MIRIIDATVEHLSIIHKLAYRIWPTVFQEILTDVQIAYMLKWMYSMSSLNEQISGGHHYLLLLNEAQFLGFAAYELNYEPHQAKLHKIYLLPSSQGQGMGKALMNKVIQRATGADQHKLYLNVNRFNNATEFYKRLGFRIIREEDNDIGNGFFMNDYVMERSL